MAGIIGYSIGRYQILEKIGEGGMATVFKANDPQRSEPVAVKIIRTDRMTRDMAAKAVHRFEREGRSLAQLNHPYIVKIFDFGRFNGYPFLVMEYLPGGTLKKRLPNKPIPWQQAARYLIPVAHALEYAHQQGIIHRDVKPSNILLNAARRPILTDFGIVKYLGDENTQDLTTTGIMVGTPEYMSPEQAMGEPFDHRVDIYSLGIIFYEMVTGRKPFYADTPVAVLVKQASEPLPPPSRFVTEIPTQVETILYKALAKKPQARYITMAEFRCALEELTSDLTTVAIPVISQPAVADSELLQPSAQVDLDSPAETASIELSDTLTHSLQSQEVSMISAENTGAPIPNVEDKGDSPSGTAQKEIAAREFKPKQLARGLVWGLSVLAILVALFFGLRFISNRSNTLVNATNTSQSADVLLGPVTSIPTITPSLTFTLTHVPTQTQLPPTPSPVSAWIQDASNISSMINWKTGTGMQAVGLAWPPDASKQLSFIQYKLANFEIEGQLVTDETPCTSSIIEYSRTGSFLMSGGCSAEQAGSVILWDRIGGNQRIVILAHKGELIDAVLSPDESRVVTCGWYDRNIKIWDSTNGEKSLTINAPADIQDLDYSPDGKFLASAHPKNIAILWDALSGEQLRVLEKPSASNGGAKLASPHPGGGFYGAVVVKFSPDGTKLAVGYRDGTLTMWEVKMGKPIYTINAHNGGVFDIRFTSDGQVLATGGEDTLIHLWEANDGSLLAELKEHKEIVSHLVFSRDNTLLASSDFTGAIIIWNIPQNDLIETPTP